MDVVLAVGVGLLIGSGYVLCAAMAFSTTGVHMTIAFAVALVMILWGIILIFKWEEEKRHYAEAISKDEHAKAQAQARQPPLKLHNFDGDPEARPRRDVSGR